MLVAVGVKFIVNRMENENPVLNNFHQLCRLCLSNTSVKIHMFDIEGFRRNLNQKILNCLSLAVSGLLF